MQVNPHIFRGYDLRGLVGEDLSEELAENLGMAYGTMLKNQGVTKAVIGRDCRESGENYATALIRGLNKTGVDTVYIGMVLVGTFYWSQYHLNIKAGVYVSASHNPPEYNGFKFANDFSETLVTDGMNDLKNLVLSEKYSLSDNVGKNDEQDIIEAYYADILARLPSPRSLRVLVDSGCTTAGAFAPELIRRAGHEVIEKNTEVSGSFPLGVADPTEVEVAERLSKEVVEAGADIGFTYDADGDRIGIVDEKGGIIWNDVLVALFAADVLTDHPGSKIMFNTLCSQLVPETIVRLGGIPFMWRTGHSFLKKKNQEEGAAFIGELSGHFFFSKDFYNHDDGLYSTMRLLKYLSSNNEPLSRHINDLPRYISSPEIKVYCADDKKKAAIEELAPSLKKRFPEALIIDDERAGDGLRFEMDGQMFVVRYSQNGPYLTIKYEARNIAGYESLRKLIYELLLQNKDIDWDSKINANVHAINTEQTNA